MSIEHDSKKPTFGQRPAQQPAQPQTGSQTQEVPPTPGGDVPLRKSVRAAIPRGMRRNRQDGMLTILRETVKEVCEEAMKRNGFNVALVSVDGAAYDMHYSLTAVVAQTVINGTSVSIIYPMVLEGSNVKPSRLSININNMPVEVVRTAMDAFDEETWNNVKNAVEAQVGTTDEHLMAGAMVIPATLDPEDKDQVWALMYNAMEAINTRFEVTYPTLTEHFNIKEFIDKSTQRVTAHFHFQENQGVSYDIANNPVRSDFRMELSIADRAQREQRFNTTSFQHAGSRTASEVTGYVNLSYSPMQYAMAQPNPYMPQHLFTPQVIYTGFSGRDYPLTPEFLFLTLGTSMLLGDNYSWGNVFRNFDREEMHDIGALALRDSQVGKIIDTKDQSFGMEQMFSLLRKYVSPHPTFTVRCEDLGPNSWITDLFKGAAEAKPLAVKLITEVMDRLTDNAFSPLWSKSTEPMAYVHTLVHLGTYPDHKGNLRDVADFDSLALLGMAENSILISDEWERTFLDPMGSPVERQVQQRLQAIEEMTSGRVEVRGHAVDVILSKTFVSCMLQALQTAGLAVEQDGLYNSFGTAYMPGSNPLAMHAAQVNASGMMSYGGMGGGINRTNFSRW